MRDSMESFAVEARDVIKRYGSRDVLRGVDLFVRPGQLHGLLGPNGAGKTTLMRVLLGLVGRDGGAVKLLGRAVRSTSDSLHDGVAGFVETPAFYPYLSGRRNLELLARLDAREPQVRRRLNLDLTLEQVGLADSADTLVGGYSAGMRQRLGLAAALIRSPRLLFLDEPTSSLDPAGARDMRELAQTLADDGAAVVWSSHDMAEVDELCTDLTVIDRGTVVFAGSADQLRERAPSDIHSLRTSDDGAALAIARRLSRLTALVGDDGSLELCGDLAEVDGYVIALGCAGIAVRSLTRRTRSLESLFLELTARPDSDVQAEVAVQ